MSPSEKKRVDAFAKVMRPSIAPLRELLATGEQPEPLKRLFQKLSLDPKKQIDCQIVAALFAVHQFAELRGAPPWDTTRLVRLLAEVHQRRKESRTRLPDEEVCRLIARDKKSPPYFRRSPGTALPKGAGLVKQLRRAKRQFAANSLARAAFPLAFD